MTIDNRMRTQPPPVSVPAQPSQQPQVIPAAQADIKSFQEILAGKTKAGSLSFSKHAQARMLERDISLSGEAVEKISTAVQKASQKGVRDTLILMDRMAFIVNVPGNVVVTALNDEDVRDNVFTNIDGTVVL